MKRIIYILSALALLVCLTACLSKDPLGESVKDASETESVSELVESADESVESIDDLDESAESVDDSEESIDDSEEEPVSITESENELPLMPV